MGSCATSCQPGQNKCTDSNGNAYCADFDTDNANCGSCGNSCGQGEVCSMGSCQTTCQSNQTQCTDSNGNAYCADLQGDNDNCGSCGTSCAAGESCQSGSCQTTCGSGQTKCTPANQPNYCTDTSTDPNNCGSCGNQCGSGEFCSGGTCTVTCQTDETLCAGQSGGKNYCAVTTSDRDNCGSCGNSCAGNQDCTQSQCVLCVPSAEFRNSKPANIPSGARISCSNCPVVSCGERTFWAFSYRDNRYSFRIVGYDAQGNIIYDQEKSGSRYLNRTSTDSSNMTATFHGQGGTSVTLPWSTFRQ